MTEPTLAFSKYECYDFRPPGLRKIGGIKRKKKLVSFWTLSNNTLIGYDTLDTINGNIKS